AEPTDSAETADLPFRVVDGVLFPKFFETNRPMKEHIECLKALEMRDDDVILCAYPKAGTHWLWEVGSMLLAGKADYDKRSKELAMMEATEIEKIQQMPSPRLLNTHVPVSMLPRQVKDKKVKVIHVYRNIKDVFVSSYFHGKQYPSPEEITIDKTLESASYPSWTVNGIRINVSGFPPDLCFLRHVMYTQDPVGTITRLAEFLGVPHTPELCRQVADACSFQRLKEADKTKEQHGLIPPAQFGQRVRSITALFGDAKREGGGEKSSCDPDKDALCCVSAHPTGDNSQTPPLVTVDGVSFPKFFETNRPMKDHIECMKSLEMRYDDVILCAFPKAGTHWLWEVGSMLLSGKAEYETRTKEFAMMEATEIEKTRALPSPRLLNTHVPVSMLPRQVKDKKVKVMHVYRNVKDVVDPVGVVTRLAEFLGVPHTPELCRQVADACSFHKMKEADKTKDQLDHLPRNQMYRKGTHWLWEVGSMLLSGKAEHDKRAKEFAMMEATEIEKTRALPSPRLLNTHVPVSMLPRQVKDKKVKVIHVYRNVKDVTVSLFFHAKQNPGMENFTIDLLMNTFFSDKGRKGNYFAYLKGMDEFIKSNPDIPVFNVSYEDTKEDPVGVVTRLAEFLGVPHTPELCRQVADACSFQKMKEVDSSKDTLDHLPRVQMYRK
ncbi:hypothetical protein BaRGS_00034190, partial [Batillaria attramentaria]